MGTEENQIVLNLKVNEKDMYAFLIHHNYSSATGILCLIGGIFCLYGGVSLAGNSGGFLSTLCLFLGLYYTVMTPFILKSRAKAQVRRNPSFKECITYRFEKEKFIVEQGEVQNQFTWNEVSKAVILKQDIVLYMGRVRAHIMPVLQMEGKETELVSLLEQVLSEKKIKGKKKLDKIKHAVGESSNENRNV